MGDGDSLAHDQRDVIEILTLGFEFIILAEQFTGLFGGILQEGQRGEFDGAGGFGLEALRCFIQGCMSGVERAHHGHAEYPSATADGGASGQAKLPARSSLPLLWTHAIILQLAGRARRALDKKTARFIDSDDEVYSDRDATADSGGTAYGAVAAYVSQLSRGLQATGRCRGDPRAVRTLKDPAQGHLRLCATAGSAVFGRSRVRHVEPQHSARSNGTLFRGLKFADAVQYLRMFRESAGFFLAVDQLAIDFDVEDAPAALDEFGGDVEFGLNRIRQTGGLRCVVSLYAIFNGNVHVGPLIRRSILLYRARGPPYNNIASTTDQYGRGHADDLW